MNTELNEITTKEQVRPIEKFRQSFLDQKSKMEKVLPAHISFEKFHSVVMTACMTNPALISADRASLMVSCIKSATDGLLPDQREAALVIFNAKLGYKDDSGKDVYGQKVQYMPMYAGVLKKARQSKEISSITTHIVYEIEVKKGLFKYSLGDDEKIEHIPYIGDEDRGEVALAYCIAKLKDGTVVREVMTRADIEKVRRTSKSGAATEKDVKWKKAEKVGDPIGIWKDWYEEMARKTVFRRAAKWLPQSVDKEGNVVRLFDNDDTMEVIEGATETESYTIETDEDGVLIEHQEEKQPDLKKEVEKKKATVASETVKKEEPSILDLERTVRKAAKDAQSAQDLQEALSGELSDTLNTIKESAPGAFQTLKAFLDARLKELEAA